MFQRCCCYNYITPYNYFCILAIESYHYVISLLKPVLTGEYIVNGNKIYLGLPSIIILAQRSFIFLLLFVLFFIFSIFPAHFSFLAFFSYSLFSTLLSYSWKGCPIKRNDYNEKLLLCNVPRRAINREESVGTVA